MKTCFKCQQSKPLSDFYRHKKMSDGYLGKCKDCAKKDARNTRANNKEYWQEYDRARADRPDRVAMRKAYASSNRGKARLRVGADAWMQRNQHKRAVHIAVGNALAQGKIIREPCACGNPKSQAHHDDYSKPFDIRWLCVKCHAAHHKAEREIKRMEVNQCRPT